MTDLTDYEFDMEEVSYDDFTANKKPEDPKITALWRECLKQTAEHIIAENIRELSCECNDRSETEEAVINAVTIQSMIEH